MIGSRERLVGALSVGLLVALTIVAPLPAASAAGDDVSTSTSLEEAATSAEPLPDVPLEGADPSDAGQPSAPVELPGPSQEPGHEPGPPEAVEETPPATLASDDALIDDEGVKDLTEDSVLQAEPIVEPGGEVSDLSAQLVKKGERKVTICHRTNSRTNPYNQIAVAESAAIEGHAGHTGPVFGPGVENWGDIIPPIRPGLPRGLNWTKGRAILKNGCEATPDLGPRPSASVGEVSCVGATPGVEVTVTNGADATAPAIFTVSVNGQVVETVGPIAPGESETVTVGGALQPFEDQTFTIEVRSGGVVVASRVVTVNCVPGGPLVEIDAQFACTGTSAQAGVRVINNGAAAVEVTATVDGAAVGSPITVGPGESVSGAFDVSQFEGRSTTVTILVDGAVVASFSGTPQCVEPQPDPRVSVAGKVCPPPTATVTLSNDGDPRSQVVFEIRVNGKVVQRSAPIFGGDSTTIVADLRRYEDQRVTIGVRSNGTLLGTRTITVDCREARSEGRPGTSSPDAVLPAVGADFDGRVLTLAALALATGSWLMLIGSPGRRTRVRPRAS